MTNTAKYNLKLVVSILTAFLFFVWGMAGSCALIGTHRFDSLLGVCIFITLNCVWGIAAVVLQVILDERWVGPS